MSNPKWNSDLPVTHYQKRGVDVPLEHALNNPNTVINTTPKTYLPTPANQVPAPKQGKN